MTHTETPADAEQDYIDAARRNPVIAKQRKTTLLALGFHLWALTREELAAVDVAILRERKHLLHGYITDAEIQSEIDKARNFVFVPVAA